MLILNENILSFTSHFHFISQQLSKKLLSPLNLTNCKIRVNQAKYVTLNCKFVTTKYQVGQ